MTDERSLETDDPEALASVARGLQLSGRPLAALRLWDRVIRLGAATADVWRATGDALVDVGEPAQALGAYERGLALEPGRADLHHGLGRALYRLGDVDAAARHLEMAISRGAGIATLLSLSSLIPGCPGADARRVLEVRSECAARLGEALAVPRPADPRRVRAPGPLRVGYVSAFFHRENYMKPVWGLVNGHDRTAFRIHLFSDAPRGASWPGYRPHAEDRVHETAGLDNAGLAALVEEAALDVLVDLNGYSVPERLPLFLARRAPVAVSWFNAFATSGLPGLPYIVGDAEVVRPEEEPFFTERVLRLPGSYLAFRPDPAAPPVTPPPSLANGFLTFGSLVSQHKVTPPALEVWAAILRRSPSSRLLLANVALGSAENRRWVAGQLERRGVVRDRLDLLGPADHATFLGYYGRIDVALDAFPYNGGTTTMEAIWQGVPVLTFDGDRWASRTSQTLLRRSHLAGFVADDVAGMIEKAVSLAASPGTPAELASLRAEMRDRLAAAGACDSAGLARGMERIFRDLCAAEAQGPAGPAG